MNNSAFGKNMEKLRKHENIKLVTKEKTRNYLLSEPICHTTKFQYQKSKKILMNKSNVLGLSILDLSKTVMHEFWYDYVKPRYGSLFM